MGVATEDETLEQRIIAVAVATGELVEVRDPETGERYYIGTVRPAAPLDTGTEAVPARERYLRWARSGLLALSVILVGGACVSAVARLDVAQTVQMQGDEGGVEAPWVVRIVDSGYSNSCANEGGPTVCVVSAGADQ